MAREALVLALFAVCMTGCASTPDRSNSAEPKPGGAVMAHAIHTPDPDVRDLQQTKAARVLKNDGTVVIGFCVDTRGKTTDLRVVESFPGDPGVDEIFLATVETWRFTPFLVDGRPMKTCTQKTFVVRFKSPASPAPN